VKGEMILKLYAMFIVLVLSAIALTGCNSSEGITQKDIGIVKADNKGVAVQYGMSRSDTEKVLGNGELVGKTLTKYDNGVSVVFRDDKVVAIGLETGSEEIYTTTSGAKIGMLEDEIKKIYGETVSLSSSQDPMISYCYNSETGEFLTTEDLNGISKRMQPPETDKLYIFSFIFDERGHAIGIQVSDGTYGFYIS
jgi:predicted small secreted protein